MSNIKAYYENNQSFSVYYIKCEFLDFIVIRYGRVS